MPIDVPGMKSGLESGFATGASTYAAAATSWSNAIQSGVAAIVPASVSVSAAASTLQGQLASAFALDVSAPWGVPAMELAFTAFALTVGGGMAPAFIAVPPIGPVGFSSLFSTTYPSASAAATAISNAITTWLETGTAAPASGGGAVPWA
jgi:hypothetical protein